MKRRQTIPLQWLVTDERMTDALLSAAASLPQGSGILFRHHSCTKGRRERLRRKLRYIAVRRSLLLVDEGAAPAVARRVHDSRELRQARLAGAKVLFLSPMGRTRSHPEWGALPRMRAAALARLAGRAAIALGGMDSRRFEKVRRLGFAGWAGIDAWLGQP